MWTFVLFVWMGGNVASFGNYATLEECHASGKDFANHYCAKVMLPTRRPK